MILHDLIFNGSYKQDFILGEYTFTLSTLSIEDEENISNLEKEKSSKLDDVFFVISVLSKTIIAINKLQSHNLYNLLLNFPINYLLKIYEKYKDLTELILKEIDTNFVEFAKSRESEIQWELVKLGYVKYSNLSNLQKSWIYLRRQIEKNEEFEKQYNIAKYIVSHITHAQINPKSYVTMVRQQKQNEDLENMQKTGQHNDLNRDVFQSVLDINEQDPKLAEQTFLDSINNKDEHDLIILEYTKELFKSALRQKRNVKKTIVKKPNIKIGLKQESILDSGVVVDKIFIRDGINYEIVFKDKFFTDIPLEDKFKILDKVY